MLLNVFFGPVANAAQAAANQAQGAIGQFSRNFQVAINPQITKSYASEQLKEMHLLIFRGSRLTFCLLLMLCLPLMIEASMVLGLWLKEVPEGTAVFLRFLLVILLVQQTASPLVTAIAATGKIKKYQMITGGLMLTIVPIAYAVLKLGGAPWSVFAVYLVIAILAFVLAVYIALPMIEMRAKDYLTMAVKPCFWVLSLSIVPPIAMKMMGQTGLLFSLLTIAVTIIGTLLASYTAGVTREEKQLINAYIRKKLHR
jgi:O-antigen/teichoic acid export membrane protein